MSVINKWLRKHDYINFLQYLNVTLECDTEQLNYIINNVLSKTKELNHLPHDEYDKIVKDGLAIHYWLLISRIRRMWKSVENENFYKDTNRRLDEWHEMVNQKIEENK